MKLSETSKNRLCWSFEIFPPKPTSDVSVMEKTIAELAALNPDFIAVTCSAGGSGNSRTADVAGLLKNKHGVEPIAHITCINSDKHEIAAELEKLDGMGIENVLALRGDRIPGADNGAFRHANELVEFIKSIKPHFDIAGACYPETHPESPSLEYDLEYLKLKVDSGVTHLITQLFFDNEDFFRFRERCLRHGIDVPIHAGIMPLVKKSNVDRIIALSGAKIPNKVSRMIAKYSDDPESLMQAGLAYATDQAADLIAGGAEGVHVYVMNNPVVAKTITDNLSSILSSDERS